MHVKQHLAARFGALFIATTSGCALIAEIGGPEGQLADDGSRGSKAPDGALETSQREGGVELATCSADLTSDNGNCGFCGHSCAGGACKAGFCEPTTIAPATDVKALAVDDDQVFYATAREVRGCPSSAQATCVSLIYPAVVYAAARSSWSSGGGNRGNNGGSPNGGGEPGAGTATPPALDLRALALFGDRFFVSDEANGVVVGCQKTTGCNATTIATVRAQREAPGFAAGLNVSASYINWGERDGLGEARLPPMGTRGDGDIVPGPVTRGVDRIQVGVLAGVAEIVFRGADGVFALGYDLDAQPVEIFAGSTVRDFAIDPRYVFVATRSSVVRVDRVTHARTTLVQLAEGGPQLERIVADSSGVYAKTTSAAGATLVRVRDGGLDAVAVSMEMGAIALSASSLFYVSAGSIRRVPR